MIQRLVFTLITVTLGISTSSCFQADQIEVIEDQGFIESSQSIPTLTVHSGETEIDLKIYGLDAARAVSESRNRGSGVIVRLVAASGHIRTRNFPVRTHVLETIYESYDNDAARIDEMVSNMSAAQGVPIVFIGPPGIFGSEGEYGNAFEQIGVEFVDQALSQIAELFPNDDIILSGASASGVLASGLLAKREDLSCVIIASAPLDIELHLTTNRAHSAYLETLALRNPVNEASEVLVDHDRVVYVGYNSNDVIVDAESSRRYAEQLEELGHAVVLEQSPSADPRQHDITAWIWQKALGCAGRF